MEHVRQAIDPESVTWMLVIDRKHTYVGYVLARWRRGSIVCPGVRCQGTIPRTTPDIKVLERMLGVMLDHYQGQSVVVLQFIRRLITTCFNE
jgi:hypothetical protein